MNSYDGFCLVAEHQLNLVDRTLAAGDAVKRKLSDFPSGTVIDVSLSCTIRPILSMEMAKTLPKDGPHSTAFRNSRFESTSVEVSADFLEGLNRFDCGDCIIYLGWIGYVKDTVQEITVRLSDGSTVVVEDPDLLNEPPMISGSEREAFMKRLNRAGYYIYQTRGSLKQNFEVRTHTAYPFYPGQIVETSQENLRRGHWKIGSYNRKIGSRGTIVEVRCTTLQVSWIFANIFKTRESFFPPSKFLKEDIIQSGLIKKHDMNRMPSSNESTLSKGSHFYNFQFGEYVKFKDHAKATAKPIDQNTGQNRQNNAELDVEVLNNFHAYEGVFQISNLRTTVMVQWQDTSITFEDPNTLFVNINVDEQDAWPGDVVSLIEQEKTVYEIGSSTIRTRAVGVVQSVDSIERLARVRWFDDTDISIGLHDRSLWVSGSLGPISERFSEVSLYEIATHPALARDRGDLVVVIPNPQSLQGAIDIPEKVALIRDLIGQTENDDFPKNLHLTASEIDAKDSLQGIDWLGEITDVLLDGRVTIRLGALTEVRDISVPISRTILVDDDEDTDDTDGSSIGDDDDLNRRDLSARTNGQGLLEPKEVVVEYEGGSRLDTDEDDILWETEDDASPELGPDASTSESLNYELPNVDDDARISRVNSPIVSDAEVFRYSPHSSMPLQFAVLDKSAPADHHFYQDTRISNKNFLRRMSKEHRILQSSTPDGIFIRTWENRLDLLRILIVGPRDTPYENSPFVLDLHLGQNFPTSPPMAYFYSWTNGTGRINPNLYEDGSICLSLLGTWPTGEKTERWSESSTILQLLISIMGLVLVKEPFYNEAGYDTFIGSEESRPTSNLYTERVFVMAKGFIKTALATPPSDIDDIIKWLYLSSQPGPRLLRLVVEESKALISKKPSADTSSASSLTMAPQHRLSSGASIMLKRTVDWLDQFLKTDEGEAPGMELSKV